MASSHHPPWVKENPDQQNILKQSRIYSSNLIKNTVHLCQTVVMVGLWMYLIALGVIDHSTKADLQMRGTNEQQVEGLLEYLLKSPCWKLHGFVKALCDNNQEAVVSQILLLNPNDYVGRHRDQDQAAHLKKLKQEIRSHHDVYERTLTKGTLFDIPSLDLPYDMTRTYIQLVPTSDEILTNLVCILPVDILRATSGRPKPKTALLSGPPGVGKSSFIRFFVYRLIQNKQGDSEWDLVVILNISTLKLTEGLTPEEHIKEAIRQSLQGKGNKEAIMQSLDNDNLSILVIPDGLDECRSPTLLKMLQELVYGSYKGKLGFTVLSTCRTGLSQIRESFFDRMMKLEGFTIEEGIEYVQKFYEEIKKPTDDSIFDYIANSTVELGHILTIPLCTHVFSIVTADGTLKLVRGQKLRLKELFNAMEKSMKRRQLEKLAEGGLEDVLTESQREEQIRWFYNMSLWALVKDIRIFDDKLLSLFKINAQHPYFTFLKRIKGNSFLTQDSHWQFTHEAFNEYFSTCALEALPDDILSALLLIISSDKKFRNTQQILFSALGGDSDQVSKLSDMIRATFITQREVYMSNGVIYQLISDIKQQAITDIYLDDLLNVLLPGNEDSVDIDTSKAQAVWETIRTLFEDHTEVFGQLLYHGGHNNEDLLKHIYDCLHEVPGEHQQLVFYQSLGRDMPSTWLAGGHRHIMYSTGGTRWSEVIEDSDGDVHVWWSQVTGYSVQINHSLTDGAEAVHHHRQYIVTQRNNKGSAKWGNISLDLYHWMYGVDCRSVWGDPPYDQFVSTVPWSDLVYNMAEWPGTANKLTLQFDGDFAHGVVGFLQCLQMKRTQQALTKLLVQDDGGRVRIEVWRGCIGSGSLLAWHQWYRKQHLQVQLRGLTCFISASDPATKQQHKAQRHRLRHTRQNGLKLFVHLKIDSTKVPKHEEEAGSEHASLLATTNAPSPSHPKITLSTVASTSQDQPSHLLPSSSGARDTPQRQRTSELRQPGFISNIPYQSHARLVTHPRRRTSGLRQPGFISKIPYQSHTRSVTRPIRRTSGLRQPGFISKIPYQSHTRLVTHPRRRTSGLRQPGFISKIPYQSHTRLVTHPRRRTSGLRQPGFISKIPYQSHTRLVTRPRQRTSGLRQPGFLSNIPYHFHTRLVTHPRRTTSGLRQPGIISNIPFPSHTRLVKRPRQRKCKLRQPEFISTISYKAHTRLSRTKINDNDGCTQIVKGMFPKLK